MRFEYFGDSYDIVKRALVQWLAPLGPWYIQPLFTDDALPQQATAFAQFLGARLVHPYQARDGKERKVALEACIGVGNLLIDPDIGVAFPKPGTSMRATHISIKNLKALCEGNRGHTVVSYDQALRREGPEESLRLKINWLARERISAIAFRSHASFLFCSTSRDQVDDVMRMLSASGLPEWRFVKAEVQ